MPRAPAPGERGAANGGAERRDALLRSDRRQLPRSERLAAQLGVDRHHRPRGARPEAIRRRRGARPGERAAAAVSRLSGAGQAAGQGRQLGKGSVLSRSDPAGAFAPQPLDAGQERACAVCADAARAFPARAAGLAARQGRRPGGHAPGARRALPGVATAPRAARAKPSTQRLKDIKLLYRLDSLIPAPEAAGPKMELDMDWLQPVLSDARSRLDALKAVWQQYVTGEPKSVLRFRELVSSFKTKAGELGNKHLIKLLDAIALVMTRLPDPYPPKSQLMVIEMASAFLLAESVLENFASPPADLQQQIGIMGGWLLDAAQGKSTGEPPAGLQADLSQRIGALQLRAQVAKEILANLQYVEQVLDAYSRELAVREALHGLETHLRQIHGALAVLRFERATQVMAICESLIKACAARERDASLEDMDWIAEGLSSLGLFLAPCVNGRDPSEKAIELFFSRYEKRAATGPATATC